MDKLRAIPDKKKVITIALVVADVFALCFVISALAASGQGLPSATFITKSVNFTMIWPALLLIVFCAGSHLAVKKYNTPLSTGFLIGATFTMSQLMLVVAVIAAGTASIVAQVDTSLESAGVTDLFSYAGFDSAGTFAGFLFIHYLILTFLLVTFKDDLAEGGADAGGVSGGETMANPAYSSPEPAYTGSAGAPAMPPAQGAAGEL